jgi:hypothetical protein
MSRKRKQHFVEGKAPPPTAEAWCEQRGITMQTLRRWEKEGKAPKRLQPGGKYGQSWITDEATAEWERGLGSTVVAAE